YIKNIEEMHVCRTRSVATQTVVCNPTIKGTLPLQQVACLKCHIVRKMQYPEVLGIPKLVSYNQVPKPKGHLAHTFH
ncbi:hypothetical protein NDU88_000998, partial [Pleurodeles waltl]